MRKQISQVTAGDVTQIADVVDGGITEEPWGSFEKTTLSAEEEQQVEIVLRRYRGIHASLINEATLWSRLVYPLLLVAERGAIKAWAEVPLAAQIGEHEIHGVVDGVLAAGGADAPRSPFLVIVEAKRGTEGANPVSPLHAALLCVGWNEAQARGGGEHLCHGCFTIADTWTFVEARVRIGQGARPRLYLTTSREYSEKFEARTILSVLRSIEELWLARAGSELEAVVTELPTQRHRT